MHKAKGLWKNKLGEKMPEDLTKKCEWKQVNDEAHYEYNKISWNGKTLMECTRRITICDICSGYETKCKGYKPMEEVGR